MGTWLPGDMFAQRCDLRWYNGSGSRHCADIYWMISPGQVTKIYNLSIQCNAQSGLLQTRQVTRATHVRNRICPRVKLIIKIIIILLIIFLGFIKSKSC